MSEVKEDTDTVRDFPDHLVENLVETVPLLGMSTDEVIEETRALGQLPEHLVENIVARIPFPSILKARTLSKGWKSKFPSVARQSFLSWPQYFSYWRRYWRKSEVVGYDAVLDSVRRIRMPVCSANPKTCGKQIFSCGSLLVAVIKSAATSLEVTVINVLTCKVKKMICPIRRDLTWYETILVPAGRKHYELMIWYTWYNHFYQKYTTFIVYNSESCNWTERSHVIRSMGQNSVYKDGTLYYIIGDEKEHRFVRLNILSGEQTETIFMQGEIALHFTVVCGSEIMTVISDSRNLIVSQFDAQSSGLVEMSRSPILEEDSHIFVNDEIHQYRFGASRNRLYLTSLRSLQEKTPLLFIYEVDSRTWSRSYFPKEFIENREHATYPSVVLELGLNPFVEP